MLVRRSFSLDTERDAALLAWLDAQPNVSEAVRTALRTCSGEQVTLATVYQAVQALTRQMSGGCPATSAAAPAAEDPELAAHLDSLGL